MGIDEATPPYRSWRIYRQHALSVVVHKTLEPCLEFLAVSLASAPAVRGALGDLTEREGR
jgi:hypothetical protein